MSVAALFTIAERYHRNNPDVHQLKNGQTKLVCSYYEILFGYKRNEIVIHATTTWINLENILLNERCHSEKHIF